MIKNDLLQVRAEIAEYMQKLRAGDSQPAPNALVAENTAEYTAGDSQPGNRLIVEKEKVAADGEYNLSGERYRVVSVNSSHWPFVPVEEVFERSVETVLPKTLTGAINYIGLENISQNTGRLVGRIVNNEPTSIKSLKNVFGPNQILYGKLRPNLNKVWLSDQRGICSTDIYVITPKVGKVEPILYSYIFRYSRFNELVMSQVKGAQLPRIGWKSLAGIPIPLPPLDVQQEIVAEIEGYQKVIDGARAVVENYRPHIHVGPDWPMVRLGEVAEIIAGQSPPGSSYNVKGVGTPFYQGKTEFGKMFIGKPVKWTTDPRRFAEQNDILMSVRAPVGPINFATQQICIGRGLAAIRSCLRQLNSAYAFYVLRGMASEITGSAGATFASINKGDIEKIVIPLPSLDVQKEIAAEIEVDQEVIHANHGLVQRFEQKIQDAIGRVWKERGDREDE